MAPKRPRLIASFSIFPLGVGTSVGDYTRKSFLALSEMKGVKVYPNAMSTVMEAGSMEKLLEAIKAAHKAMLDTGAQRIYMVLTVDDRRDRPHTAGYKLERLLTGKAAQGA